MENARNTYFTYRDVTQSNKSAKTASLITTPKTLENTMDTFFELFKDVQKQAILQRVDYEGFKRIIKEKDKMPFDKKTPNFDTPQELEEGRKIVEAFEVANKNKI
jgi:SPX domain protein involved in polyphosphate accumulation